MKSKSKRPETGFSKRGTSGVSEAQAWLANQNIEEIECMVPPDYRSYESALIDILSDHNRRFS
jgi:hypothetical protein